MRRIVMTAPMGCAVPAPDVPNQFDIRQIVRSDGYVSSLPKLVIEFS